MFDVLSSVLCKSLNIKVIWIFCSS